MKGEFVMKLTLKEEVLFEMANVRGKTVKVPGKLEFSFFFSTKDAVESKDIVHGLRVKPVFNPERISISEVGTLKLHGDWKYIPGKNDKNVGAKQIKEMKNFFKMYKILFASVWEKQLPHDALEDYIRGYIDFQNMIKEFYFYEDYKHEMDNLETIQDLEKFVSENNLFNTWED